MSKPDYKAMAKALDIHYLIGRWGIQFVSRNPSGRIYSLVRIVPLDGWVTDPKEIERIMRERGMEL